MKMTDSNSGAEGWREENVICMAYSDRKPVYIATLKQTSFCFCTGTSPLPVLQFIVPFLLLTDVAMN